MSKTQGKTEKPVPFMVRLYKRDKAIIKKAKRALLVKASDAYVIRHALRYYADRTNLV